MNSKLAETSVVKSRPSVPYEPNLFYIRRYQQTSEILLLQNVFITDDFTYISNIH